MDTRTTGTADMCGCVGKRTGDRGRSWEAAAVEAVVAAALDGAEKRKAEERDSFVLPPVLAGLAAAAVDELADRVVRIEERIRWAEDVLQLVSDMTEDSRFDDARDVLRSWREGQNETANTDADAEWEWDVINRPDWW